MPTLHVHLNQQPTQERKRKLIEELTTAVCQAIGKNPDDVTIYLYCHTGGAHDMAFDGALISDRAPAAVPASRGPRREIDE
jgi:hypothetical protein